MKVSAYKKIKLASHIERKVSGMNIGDSNVEALVYDDIEKQLKREFGLTKKHPDIKLEHLYEAHELIDCYKVPLYLKEMIEDANPKITLKD